MLSYLPRQLSKITQTIRRYFNSRALASLVIKGALFHCEAMNPGEEGQTGITMYIEVHKMSLISLLNFLTDVLTAENSHLLISKFCFPSKTKAKTKTKNEKTHLKEF
jgi:hypothetical protein